MSLYLRPNSPYWWSKVQVEGQTYRQSTRRPHGLPEGSMTAPSRLSKDQLAARREAEAVENAFLRSLLDKKQLGVREPITLGQALERRLAVVRKTKSRSIVVREESMARVITGAGGIPGSLLLSKLTTDVVARHRDTRLAEGKKPASVNLELALLSTIYHLAADEWGCEVAPVVVFKKLPTKGKLRYLSVSEEQALLEELWPLRNRAGWGHPMDRHPRIARVLADQYDLVVFLLDTGARYSEVATITWDCIDTHHWRWISLYRSKVDNEDHLQMTDRLRVVLMWRWQERGNGLYVFPGQNDPGAPRGHATAGIMKAMLRAGINTDHKAATLGKATVHTLRDTFASRLAENDYPLHKLQALLGHSTMTQTLKYAKFERRGASTAAASLLDTLRSGR